MDVTASFRATSACRFAPTQSLKVTVPDGENPMRLVFQTREVKKGGEFSIPGDLWIDVRGQAASLEQAVDAFGRAAENINSIIALCTNAAISDLELHLAFDCSKGEKDREFVQSLLPDESIDLVRSRNVDVELVKDLMNSIAIHPERERIGRAIAQYSLALINWKLGRESLGLAHLYMGVEAISIAVLRSKKDKMSEDEFATQLGIDPTKLDPCKKLRPVLEAAVRKQIIFQGDETIYSSAKKASDGFEHGFLRFDEVVNHAKTARNQTAYFLRKAVLDLLELPIKTKEKLLATPYDAPLGCFAPVDYVRGLLNGDMPENIQDDLPYPIVHFRRKIAKSEVTDEGHEINYSENLSPKTPEGVTLSLKRRESWGV